ncbi:hypothetical protein [Micromonospora polyrhachis]|uniref:Uncharacterized protein n=1 Tax=Micromonospora polyrhachis TaxID=1282883 RepID=A0A7W7SPX1_9ACTN|nr:hypothetical protein [Micromonospora polyrhachis]MBB4958779.1 hypothetical protein [Micromonospora polyrhachis]
MSESMNPAAPTARQRPGVVTISSYLLYLVAGLQVLGLIMALAVLGTLTDIYEEAYAGTDMADVGATAATIGVIGGAIFGLLVAIGLVVLAIFNSKGKNPSRIVTWVLGGIFACCSGFGLLGTAASDALTTNTGGTTTGPDPAEIQRMVDEGLPGWYNPLTLTITVITLIALLVALILLALPAANEFFRKPDVPGWEPPLPGGTYPGYPQSYPQYPASGPASGPSGPVDPSYPPSSPPYPGNPPSSPPGPGNPPYPPAPPAS